MKEAHKKRPPRFRSNSSFYIFGSVSEPLFSFLDPAGANTQVKGPFLTHLEHQAAWAISLTSRRTSRTAFAVWMPKKMYRISVNFVLALMRFRP